MQNEDQQRVGEQKEPPGKVMMVQKKKKLWRCKKKKRQEYSFNINKEVWSFWKPEHVHELLTNCEDPTGSRTTWV